MVGMDHQRSLEALEERLSIQTLPSYTAGDMDEILREVTCADDAICACTALAVVDHDTAYFWVKVTRDGEIPDSKGAHDLGRRLIQYRMVLEDSYYSRRGRGVPYESCKT